MRLRAFVHRQVTHDAFDTLGIEPRFALEPALLDARHRELGKALHPDRFAGAPAGQRRRALSEAIGVNHAHRALKDPLERAALLAARARRALGLPEHADAPKPSPALLMEVLELREELATARAARDEATAARLAEAMTLRQRELSSQLERLFDVGPLGSVLAQGSGERSAAADAAAEPLARAEAIAAELRYVRRFLDEVAAMQDDLDDAV